MKEHYTKIFENIYVDNGFGGTEETRAETRSGPGSTLEATENVRKFILDVVDRYDIKTVVDLPCGDFNWMKEIAGKFDSYTGLDISKSCIIDNKKKYPEYTFKVFDAVTGRIPDCDLLIVRDMLGHMPLEYSKMAFENIKATNWKYMIGTNWLYINENGVIDPVQQFKHTNDNIDEFGQCFLVNLMMEPLNLGAPIEFIYDMEDIKKTQCLWSRVPKQIHY